MQATSFDKILIATSVLYPLMLELCWACIPCPWQPSQETAVDECGWTSNICDFRLYMVDQCSCRKRTGEAEQHLMCTFRHPFGNRRIQFGDGDDHYGNGTCRASLLHFVQGAAQRTAGFPAKHAVWLLLIAQHQVQWTKTVFFARAMSSTFMFGSK